MWSLIGGGAVVVVAAAVAVFLLLQQASGQSVEDRAAAMSAPVEGYLQALADGDAETALSFLSDPDSSPLLTDEVLAVSNELAPLTGIEVGSVDPETLDESGALPEIPATYTLGGATVDVVFSITDGGREDGEYRIVGGLGEVSMPSGYAGVGPLVNGVSLDAEFAAAFPGTYELTVEDDRFEVASGAVAPVTQPYESASFWQAELALTESALTSLRQLITDEVNACVASKNLDPGCGLALTPQINNGAVTLKDGTVTRALTGDAQTTLSRLEIDVDTSDPLRATTQPIGAVDVTAEATDGNLYELWIAPRIGSAMIDLAGDEPIIHWD